MQIAHRSDGKNRLLIWENALQPLLTPVTLPAWVVSVGAVSLIATTIYFALAWGAFDERVRRKRQGILFYFAVFLAALSAVAIPAFIIVNYPASGRVPESVWSSKELNGWGVLLALFTSVISWIPYLLLVAIVLLFWDSVFYVLKFRRPYLLAVLGRDYPEIEESVEKVQRSANDAAFLLSGLTSVIRSAEQILSQGTSSWTPERIAESSFFWLNETLKSLEEVLQRGPEDFVRASIWLREEEQLEFLTGPSLPEADRDPLPIETSIAGNTIRLTVGDALKVENIEDGNLSADFSRAARITSGDHFRALMCLPIRVQMTGQERQPVAVLSIDSILARAFSAEEVRTALGVAQIAGFLLQRVVDVPVQDQVEGADDIQAPADQTIEEK